MSEWIKVEDALPEGGRLVLFVWDDYRYVGSHGKAYRNIDHGVYRFENGWGGTSHKGFDGDSDEFEEAFMFGADEVNPEVKVILWMYIPDVPELPHA